MRKYTVTVALIIAAVLALGPASNGFGQFRQDLEGQRLAQTGMKFLSISVDPRAAAVADAVAARDGSSISMLYNPAGMASGSNQTVEASLGQTRWIGDVRYNYATAAYTPSNGNYGVIGLSAVTVEYGEFLETIRANNERGYRDIGSFSPSAVAFGLGYARTLTDRFAVGGHVKYVRQSLGASTKRLEDGNPVRGDNSVSTIATDFGVLYRTGFRSLNFAFSARNFSSELTYAEESFELPLTFEIGLAMDVMDFTDINSDTHSFVVSIAGQRPRDFYEHIKVGAEYMFMDILALRGGYRFPRKERGLSLGTGLHFEVENLAVQADYSYSQFTTFGNVNRIGFGFSF